MVNTELLDYIKQQLEAGADKEDIRKTLLQSDWTDADIDEAFGSLPHAQAAPTPQAPQISTNNNEDDVKNIYTTEVKYNPFKDAGFWAAFVLGGTPFLILLSTKGAVSQVPFLINTVFVFVWNGWIFFKKGKKGSFLVGFLISAVITAIISWPLLNWSMQKKTEEWNRIAEIRKECYDRVAEKSVTRVVEGGGFNQNELNEGYSKCSKDPNWNLSIESESVVNEDEILPTALNQNTDKEAVIRDKTKVSQVQSALVSLIIYYDSNGVYPNSLSDLSLSIPILQEALTLGGTEYSYERVKEGSDFVLTFELESVYDSRRGQLSAGRHTATQSGIAYNK